MRYSADITLFYGIRLAKTTCILYSFDYRLIDKLRYTVGVSFRVGSKNQKICLPLLKPIFHHVTKCHLLWPTM